MADRTGFSPLSQIRHFGAQEPKAHPRRNNKSLFGRMSKFRKTLLAVFFIAFQLVEAEPGGRVVLDQLVVSHERWNRGPSVEQVAGPHVIQHIQKDASKASMVVDTSQKGRGIPDTLFGIFFEEINHAGTGGLDAELVQNRGFEAGGHVMPSTMDPWEPHGREGEVQVSTDLSSCFDKNPVALRIDVLCENCKPGVGILNPGFWGMNIEKGKAYEGSLWLRATMALDLDVVLASSDQRRTIAKHSISFPKEEAWGEWKKVEFEMVATETDHAARLLITTGTRGTLWLDQVSLRPKDTFKGLGFRKDLAEMLVGLNPGFVRFPGGCYVEGQRLADAFRWRQTVGPKDNRPGHWNDVWGYWSDDGLGLLEYLQLSEALGAAPVWVFNNGISHTDEVPTAAIAPFVEDILDGLEFIRGPSTTTWGALRAQMGHPEPFALRHVAIGNEDCWRHNYQGNYVRFYDAIKAKYPDIHIISNCDATWQPLKHPADLFDFHVYAPADRLFSLHNKFDTFTRKGPKVFASEFAVTGKDSGHRGTLKGALAEAAFMLGLEKNSDIVEMASYAPLFVHESDRRWSPDAIIFDSWRVFGSPSYHIQTMFRHSRGSLLLPSTLTPSSPHVLASAVRRFCSRQKKWFLTIKAVNYGSTMVDLTVALTGGSNEVSLSNAVDVLVLTSTNSMDENSFEEPRKVTPKSTKLECKHGNVTYPLQPHSFAVFDIASLPPSKSTAGADKPPGTSYLRGFEST